MDLIKIMRRTTCEKRLGLNANKAAPDVTALYERLSRDDDHEGESNSIINQKALLENYAQEHGFTNIRHYTDDGFTGGDFDRPGWEQLIRDIEAGIVQTVIAKDMSRIGRNHIDTGFYTEIFFPRMDVRFIAVNNNVDSEDPESMEFTGFMNILNEWYLRDQSKKTMQAVHQKARSGKHIASVPPFGYMKDPQCTDRWVIDPEAAQTVRYIFELACRGLIPAQIARCLRLEHFETPGYYLAQRGKQNYERWENKIQPYDWTTKRVIKMLQREEYKGFTVNLRTAKPNVASPTVSMPRDQWLIFEGTQEPIVDADTWQKAQQALRNLHSNQKRTVTDPLAGVVFCAACGKRMHYTQYDDHF